ncbi:unnamed protein product [Periconia digitata]|uniref:Uncharacterized protein n=1 Tax=Periconia digitata TaxID=1303443 RepID=A0A9W4UDV3_9PLEO|nr:unnamed protein product [Periconia digitata]
MAEASCVYLPHMSRICQHSYKPAISSYSAHGTPSLTSHHQHIVTTMKEEAIQIHSHMMSMFSKFKKKMVAEKDKDKDREKSSVAAQEDTMPKPTPMPQPTQCHTCAARECLLETSAIPIPPKSSRRIPPPLMSYSPEEAQLRIAAVKKRKSEMSLRATTPPKRFYAQSNISAESLEPPSRPLLRVRSNMSMRVSVPKETARQEPARPKTSSGASTGSRPANRYIDNYSFYAHNQPLREFSPFPPHAARAVSAPQVARARTSDNSGTSRKSPRAASLKRPSLLDLTMEEEPTEYRSSESQPSRCSEETSKSITAPYPPYEKLPRFAKMRSLPALRMKRPSGLPNINTDLASLKTEILNMKPDMSSLKTEFATFKTDVINITPDLSTLKTDMSNLRSEILNIRPDILSINTDISPSHYNAYKSHYSSSSHTPRSVRSPKSPQSPVLGWRYEDFGSAPPVPSLSTGTGTGMSSPSALSFSGIMTASRNASRSVSRRASLSSLFSKKNGSAVWVH